MTRYNLALILIVFWITSGCQVSQHSTSSSQYAKNQAISQYAPEQYAPENENIPKTPGLNKKQLASKAPEESYETLPESSQPIFSKSEPLTSDSETGSEKQSLPSDLLVQQKIDQALALCNDAQQMWEAGDIDEALINLDSAYSTILEIDSDVSPESNQQKEDIRYLISKRILEIYASRQIVVNGQYNAIPLIINSHVQKEIDRFTGPERDFFIRSMERSGRYRPFIVSELKKAGLPEELSWLPLIESGFKIRALSSARALGLWQFIPSTGYKFGLNRNYYVDERLDPEKATLAAIAYLKELHNLFGDWTTVLAAYNCGEGRVLNIIRKQRINYLDNFWDLYQNLPRETSRYVPRFLATLHVINNLDKYNIKVENPLLPVAYKICEVTKQTSLKKIAQEIDVRTAVLKDLNPELRYALLPPETYQLRVPEVKADLLLSKIDQISTTDSLPAPSQVQYHRVRKGETLSGIAKKYRTSIRKIAMANNINRSNQIFAGKVLKIPGSLNPKRDTATASHRVTKGEKVTYTVRRGDNLWKIARKFNTTTKNIQTENNISSTALSIGQTLIITSGKQVLLAKEKTSTHIVQPGDSPFSIAKKYEMDLNRLLALNDMNKITTIFPGQQLIVE